MAGRGKARGPRQGRKNRDVILCSVIAELKGDIAHYKAEEGTSGMLRCVTFWIVVWYRLGHWMYRENCPRLLCTLLKLVYIPVYLFIQTFIQIRIPPSAEIGAGLYVSHVGGILISPEAVIGTNCDMSHHVTIGVSAMGRRGVPRIGNNVYLGTGSTLIGKISIGDGAKIAANTLVMNTVPAGATVMGVPGRIIMRAPEQTQPRATVEASQ
jgi:serine O-acetyltransferase